MTQSKKTDIETTINIDELDLGDLLSDDIITVDFNDTYGTTTTYWASNGVNGITIGSSNDTFTLTDSDVFSSISIDRSSDINPDRVERMCKHYPALEKVWRNFKSVYDMVEQDYKGNYKDLDDDIPF